MGRDWSLHQAMRFKFANSPPILSYQKAADLEPRTVLLLVTIGAMGQVKGE
jgi:hypothetical protein